MSQVSLMDFSFSSPPCESLSKSDKVSGRVDSNVIVEYHNHCPPRYVLSFKQANDFAFLTVHRLPLGAQFTCYSLFHDIRVSFDRRRLNVIMHNLVRTELVSGVGWVPSPRETGNASVAQLWEKVKEI